ncbi:MAG TPA: GntR family transcriptional regulator [Thermoanaerobaculia bacterium]|jgi:GntR family transcriptional regulator|nr:GntR family transcriptional regulator [Thermoanaerobaculia bacterium]
MTRRREEIQQALRHRVSSGLHLGLLHPGERLASARETAKALGTDYRVVVAAARALEREGLIEIRPRAGIFIGGAAPSPASVPYLAGFATRLVNQLVDDVAIGAPAQGFPERARRCLQTVHLRAACLECNEDQREAMAEELRERYGIEAVEVDLEQVDAHAPSLRGVDLLVSTSHHAGEVRRLAMDLAKPYVLVTLDSAQRREIAALLLKGPIYFVGVDPRWETKARAIWGDEPGAAANLRHLTLGRDALESIPADAAVMVMPSARRRLAGHPLLARALPQRGFSRESARQILAFVVQANIAAFAAP